MLKRRKTTASLLLITLFSFKLFSTPIEKNIPPLHFTEKSTDQFEFGRLWQQIKRLNKDGLLPGIMAKRREEIAQSKDHWKSKLPFAESAAYLEDVQSMLEKGTLVCSEQGCGSAYFLYNAYQVPCFVIKPCDEDILCLNNRKHFASPYNDHVFRVRDEIPLYRSAQAEALAYCVASILGCAHLTPATYLAVLSHEAFFDISDRLEKTDSHLPREKLCSVQTYVHGMESLYVLAKKWLEMELNEEKLLAIIDQSDFEKLSLFIWIIYDTDAHSGNLYARKDPQGIYHIIKVDNGLTFPEKNKHLLNGLFYFPQAMKTFSPELREFILNLPIDLLVEKIKQYELESTLDAFYERVHILQNLIKNPSITLREIDQYFHAIEEEQ